MTNNESRKDNLISFHDLFVHEMKKLMDAKNQCLKLIVNYKNRVFSVELNSLLEDYFDVSEIQMKRIEEIFHQLHLLPESSYNSAIFGLIKEGAELTSKISNKMITDAAIITNLQKIKHYEIACYGCLRTFSMVLGYDEASDLLQASLDEEIQVDKLLTDIAESFVNEEANHS